MSKIASMYWDSSVTGERTDHYESIKNCEWYCGACGERLHYEKENMVEFYYTKEDGMSMKEFIGTGPTRYVHATEACMTHYILSIL